jgi:hypothetical protein
MVKWRRESLTTDTYLLKLASLDRNQLHELFSAFLAIFDFRTSAEHLLEIVPDSEIVEDVSVAVADGKGFSGSIACEISARNGFPVYTWVSTRTDYKL